MRLRHTQLKKPPLQCPSSSSPDISEFAAHTGCGFSSSTQSFKAVALPSGVVTTSASRATPDTNTTAAVTFGHQQDLGVVQTPQDRLPAFNCTSHITHLSPATHQVGHHSPMDTTAFGHNSPQPVLGHNSPQPSRQYAEIVAPSPPLNFSSRRANLLAIGSYEKEDLNFMDYENLPNTPGSIQPVPSKELLAHATITVHNFLKMGLLHFRKTQKAAMLSAASLLRTSPYLSGTELDRLLKDLPSLISRSEAARVSSSEMFQTLNSFRAKRIKKDELDCQDQALYDQLVQVTAAFDADEAQVQRLEEMKKKIDEEIEQYKVKMAAHLETGESLGRSLSVVRDDSHALGQELASQKDEYATWTKNLREAEKAQSDCLAQWEKLRDILTGCSDVAWRSKRS